MDNLIAAFRARIREPEDKLLHDAGAYAAQEQAAFSALEQQLVAARRRRLQPSVGTAYNASDVVIPPLLVKPKPALYPGASPPASAAASADVTPLAMPSLARAARAIEAQLLLRCVAQWEQVCSPLWKALAGAASAEYNASLETKTLHAAIPMEHKTLSREDEMFHLSYAGYSKICGEIDALRQEGLEALSPAARQQMITEQEEMMEAAMREYRQKLQRARAANLPASQMPRMPTLDDVLASMGAADGGSVVGGVDPTYFHTAVQPSDVHCDAVEDGLLRLYAEFLPKVDAALFMSCPRHARTGTVDVRVLYEHLQIQIAVAKFGAEMLLLDEDGDRSVGVEHFEAYIVDTLETVPGNGEIVRKGLVDAHKTAQVERFVWLLEKAHQSNGRRRLIPAAAPAAATSTSASLCPRHQQPRLDLRQIMETQDLKDLLLQPLKPEVLSGHPSESVRWFSCANTLRLVEEFRRLDTMMRQRLRLGDMRRYRKFLREQESGPSPLRPDVSPISFSFIKRYFECTQTHNFELDFRCFVRFVLTVELLPQRCPRPDLFFDCFDVDGAGVLTPTRMSKFIGETRAKLAAEFDSYGATAERQVDDLFHLIRTAVPYEITRREFVQSVNNGLFCALTVDAQALLTYEQRDWTNPKIKQDELSARPWSGRR